MEGRARAASRDFEGRISQAWHGEAFAREKKLGRLSKYLKASDKPQGNSRGGGALIGAMMEMKARGVPMEIRRVKLKRKPNTPSNNHPSAS